MWYIEEYLFVVYGKVAIALVNSVARKWESTGRQFLVRPNASVGSEVLVSGSVIVGFLLQC